MKLTIKQKDALQILKEEKSLPKNSSKLHTNVMNALYFKGLVQLTRYANGELWEMTDAGYNALEI